VDLGISPLSKRYEDKYHRYRKEPSGGIGAFTPDNFPYSMS